MRTGQERTEDERRQKASLMQPCQHAARLDTASLERVLPQIQSIIEASRQHVVSTTNLTLVWLYWNVGRVIAEDTQLPPKHALAERLKIYSRLLEQEGNEK